MRLTTLVMACLAGANVARQLFTGKPGSTTVKLQHSRSHGSTKASDPLKALATLLLSAHPDAGYHVSSGRLAQSLGLQRAAVTRPRAGNVRSQWAERTSYDLGVDPNITDFSDNDPYMKIHKEFLSNFGNGVDDFGPGIPEVQDFESIPSRVAQKLCTREGWAYLDVRSEEELFQCGRPDVPLYVSIPSHMWGFDKEAWLKQVRASFPDKNSKICVGGAVSVSTRSKATAHALVQDGYTSVREVEDGFFGWLQRGTHLTLYETFADYDDDPEEKILALSRLKGPGIKPGDAQTIGSMPLPRNVRGAAAPAPAPVPAGPEKRFDDGHGPFTWEEFAAYYGDNAQAKWNAGTPAAPPPAPAPVRENPAWTGPAVERCNGVVKMFNLEKGFGFITREDGQGDVFVHQSAVYSPGFRSLLVNEPVEFDLVTGADGKSKAADVTGPDGEYVQGCPRDQPQPAFVNPYLSKPPPPPPPAPAPAPEPAPAPVPAAQTPATAPATESAGSAALFGPGEKRLDAGQGPFTYKEFEDYYGPNTAMKWNQAEPEKRLDAGHGPYTYQEFKDYYGPMADTKWEAGAK
mmetsp:Transcript_45215/g.78415  ORF Transcript_45215/g.78415 Transcript_45215/m.78415 type:complete len:575 (+) Transcript_45215:68-1792(+)